MNTLKLIIVESPAKIYSISKLLNNEYKVVASYGHIAELEGKGQGIDIQNNFDINLKYNPHKNVKEMITHAKNSSEIYLATDFDREGEKISYDILNFLIAKKYVKKNTKFYRITFNEITKKAIEEGIKNKHDINNDLVLSQEARTTIDYLYGFNLSPVLWYKLPGAKSAGRVQSVALRMICEKENDIRDFKQQEYWSLMAIYKNIEAKLDIFYKEKVEKFTFKNEESVSKAQETLSNLTYKIANSQSKEIIKKPYAPFITSSLQKEAYLRYGFGVKKTMQIAQKLYEGTKEYDSLITYMRTDSVHISEFGLNNIRTFIKEKYGEKYLSPSILTYTTKNKNAQEAHEAIRAIDVNNLSHNIALNDDEKKIYDLIWKRTVSCQMSNNKKKVTYYNINSQDLNHKFVASYTQSVFDGFTLVYDYLKFDDDNKFDLSGNIIFDKMNVKQHFTEPPARYNEGSLIENLEKYGIGRPSTYASIISTIIERNYVKLEKKKLIPSSLGEVVVIFLKIFFPEYVDFHFTANIEDNLDKIANGEMVKLDLLQNFWNKFNENISSVKKIQMSDILKQMQDELQKIFNVDKKCKKCNKTLIIMIGKYGPYLSCVDYPECHYIENIFEPFLKILGQNDKGEDIFLKKGKFGYYVQLNDNKSEVNLTKENTTLEDAKKALSFPRVIGEYEGVEVFVAKGKFGYYAKVHNIFVSVPKNQELSITLDSIINLYHKKLQKLNST